MSHSLLIRMDYRSLSIIDISYPFLKGQPVMPEFSNLSASYHPKWKYHSLPLDDKNYHTYIGLSLFHSIQRKHERNLLE